MDVRTFPCPAKCDYERTHYVTNELLNILHKISRTHAQVMQIEPLYFDFIKQNPFQLKRTVDANKKIITYCIEGLKEAPIDIRISTGEILTHLRSALDQMIWQLSLFFTDSPYGNTQFPICETAEDFEKRGMLQMRSLDNDLKHIIRELQPFNTEKPKTHLLWRLNRLANDDKHRYPTIVNANMHGFGVSRNFPDGVAVEAPAGPIYNGSVLVRVDFSKFASEFTEEIEKSMDVTYSLGIALKIEDDPALLPAKSTLLAFGEAVEHVARKFEPFFDSYGTGS
jgi:hypothetical protein